MGVIRQHQSLSRRDAQQKAIALLGEMQIPDAAQVMDRRIASIAVTDFPEPDSPTTPTISPRPISSETWLSAWTSPRKMGKLRLLDPKSGGKQS